MPPTTAAELRSIARGPVRRSRRRLRRLATAVVAVTGAGVLAVVGVAVAGHSHRGPGAARCVVGAGDGTYTVDPVQAQNAATISAVASRLGLPDHAVTIALATALQESKLVNLPYGDRDSLGLFQQRPSQGWGTAAQVSDPTYAATAFYRALVRLPHWRTDDVATAAQAVQRSADGTAYAAKEDEARALAIALTGEQPAAITCSGGALATGRATTTTTTAAVRAEVAGALGATALAPGTDTALGRSAAAWLVANANADGITAVAYAGERWTAARGSWVADPQAGTTVSFLLARAATA